MFRRLYDWVCGNSSVDFWGEKQTPETKPEEPLPQPEVETPKESRLERIRREQAEREEQHIKELQEKVNEIILTEEEFSVGDRVQYLKVPNNNVEFYVVQYYHARVSQYYFTHIESGKVLVHYFDANQNLQSIKDEIKWFKKV